MKIILKILILFLVAFYWEFFFSRPGWMGVLSPPLPFLIILFISLKWKEMTGAMSGFVLGGIYAGLFSEPPGLSCLSFTLLGYFAGKVAPFIMDTPRIVLFVFALCMILLYHFLCSILMSIFYEPMLQLRFLSAVVGGAVFAYFHPLLERLFMKSRR